MAELFEWDADIISLAGGGLSMQLVYITDRKFSWLLDNKSLSPLSLSYRFDIVPLIF